MFLFLFVPSVSQTPKTKTDGELRALAKGTQQKGSGLPEIPPGCNDEILRIMGLGDGPLFKEITNTQG